MSAVTAAHATDRLRPIRPVVWAGAAAGVLDILAAFVSAGSRGTAPMVVLKAVASGVLGRGAFRLGPEAAALGLLLHLIIALGWAALYYVASRRLPLLVRRPALCGALYGVVVYLLMHYVVVPLSAAPPFAGAPSLRSTAIAIGIHVCFVGLPISLVIARHARRGGWA